MSRFPVLLCHVPTILMAGASLFGANTFPSSYLAPFSFLRANHLLDAWVLKRKERPPSHNFDRRGRWRIG